MPKKGIFFGIFDNGDYVRTFYAIMNTLSIPNRAFILSTALLISPGLILAKPKNQAQQPTLSEAGKKLEAEYAALYTSLQKEISEKAPKISDQKQAALQSARESLKVAQQKADAAAKFVGELSTAKALIGHAKNKWIGGADQGIAKANQDLKNAKTPEQKAAAEKSLADWQENRRQGEAALKEREANLARLSKQEAEITKNHQSAQAALAKAKADERNAANALIAEINPFLASDKLDDKLLKAAIIHHGTPQRLAAYADKGVQEKALLGKLFSDTALMREILLSGGASFGEYGNAIEIYTAIQKASDKAKSGHFQRLALATSLEHARPIPQSSIPAFATGAPATINPVKRYLHYEKAFLDGELDPAFKDLKTWEYRHFVNCDAPDEILTWGRQMLRTYRPDHIYNADYGWRYVMSVRTEVPYGSQNVHLDLTTNHQYQNIMMNGGVCGRRAFYGRFILRSFGIPTWGVTQKAHAALSHWTPKGWVVNLGAGYHSSWWDKDEVSMSGNQFLQETQARAHTEHFIKVQRAIWVSRALNEQQYNDRRGIAGGFWSKLANDISAHLASTAVTLGPLGQELGEANESQDKKIGKNKVSITDQKITVNPDGSIEIPAVVTTKPTGKFSVMASIDEGFQIHALGGFGTQYEITSAKAGKYELTAKVATVQNGQVFRISANATQANETPVPYTKGLWQATEPVVIELTEGRNIINFALTPESRGVTIKSLSLTPAK